MIKLDEGVLYFGTYLVAKMLVKVIGKSLQGTIIVTVAKLWWKSYHNVN